MAERQPEEEVGKFQCALCPNVYKSAKSLKKHLDKNHADDPRLQEAKKSVPKDTCPFCRDAFGNVSNHKRSCKKNPQNPDVALPPQVPPARVQPAGAQPLPKEPPPRVPQQEYEGMSDDDLVQKFCDRMTNRRGLQESSIKEYVRHLKAFIQHEKRKDSGFMAWRWFASGTKEQPDDRFVVFRPFMDYVEALITDQGRATKNQMLNVYLHINDWITQKVREQMQGKDYLAQLERNKADSKDSRKLLQKGTLQPGQGRKVRDPVTERLDPNISQSILQHFVDSPMRGETLERFSRGDFTSPCLEIRDEQGVQDFLALLLYLQNFGTRFDVVQNMTVDELTRAQHALDQCPHCLQRVMYGEHKTVCLVRQSPEGYDKAKDIEASEKVGKWWRIRVEEQKTQSKYGPVELALRATELEILKTFTRIFGPSNYR